MLNRTLLIGNDKDKDVWAYQDFRVNATKEFSLECEEVFVNNIDKIEDGTFDGDLIKSGKYKDLYEAIVELENSIFGKPDIVRIEAGGKNAISGLLDKYFQEAEVSGKLFKTIPFYPKLKHESDNNETESIRRIVDYVSGMTDRYTISQFQEISGMSL